VSGESAAGEFSTDENEEEESQTIEKNDDYDHHALLYDKNLDDEDEAYVYKHMRGGIREPVTTNGSGATSTSNVTPSTSNEDYPVASTAGAKILPIIMAKIMILMEIPIIAVTMLFKIMIIHRTRKEIGCSCIVVSVLVDKSHRYTNLDRPTLFLAVHVVLILYVWIVKDIDDI